MTNVRSCPFCKSELWETWHIEHLDKPWVVGCLDCMAMGPQADTEKEAIKLWNRRAKE